MTTVSGHGLRNGHAVYIDGLRMRVLPGPLTETTFRCRRWAWHDTLAVWWWRVLHLRWHV